MNEINIGFGGGCHWCTEAVFQSLRGVLRVDQGFIKSTAPFDDFSEAVNVCFDASIIPVEVLVQVHLRTHACTSKHKMRGKYRSAVYVNSEAQLNEISILIDQLQKGFSKTIVTQVLIIDEFKFSMERYHNYYEMDPNRPFCKNYIDPKLAKIKAEFSKYYDPTADG